MFLSRYGYTSLANRCPLLAVLRWSINNRLICSESFTNSSTDESTRARSVSLPTPSEINRYLIKECQCEGKEKFRLAFIDVHRWVEHRMIDSGHFLQLSLRRKVMLSMLDRQVSRNPSDWLGIVLRQKSVEPRRETQQPNSCTPVDDRHASGYLWKRSNQWCCDWIRNHPTGVLLSRRKRFPRERIEEYPRQRSPNSIERAWVHR